MNEYSVLLMYPNGDTFYTWVEAEEPYAAVTAALAYLVEDNRDADPAEMTVLAVLAGHVVTELSKEDI
jgi:hypothetical protein